MNYIDMHTHTTASDGTYTPIQLVDYAIKKGLNAIAITDHDTIDGIEEAMVYCRKIPNFFVLPGIELSTEYLDEEVHILGYNINYKFKELLNLLNTIQKQRIDRVNQIIHKLNALDISITYEEVIKIAGGGTIGRPHIARILVEKKYVDTIEGAFQKFLNKGAPAYAPRYKLSPCEAIDIIKKTGGHVSIAHPGLIQNKRILNNLLEKEVDGIEVYHPDHKEKNSNEFLTIAKTHGIIVTGGSDFHSPPQNKNKRHGDLGSKTVLINSIEKFLHNIEEW